MPVGLMDGAAFAVAEERMEPGDKLVIYTDGVTEAQNAAGEFFGRKRLRETVVGARLPRIAPPSTRPCNRRWRRLPRAPRNPTISPCWCWSSQGTPSHKNFQSHPSKLPLW